MAASRHIHLCIAAAALAVAACCPAYASAAPKLKKGAAVDSDGDGSVDAFDLTFSAKLRGKAKSGTRLPFSVSGYRVTAVAKPRGKRVRLKVAEGSVCDLGAMPKITFLGGSLITDSKKHRLRRSRLDLGRADKRPPRLTCVTTGDADRDGHIDTVVLTWSRPVRSPAVAGPGPFGVDRYSVASTGAAKGRFLRLKLKEKSSFDTGEVPAVFYRKPRQAAKGVRATARRRGAARSTTYNDTRDRALARLVSARTDDATLDGRVDGVVAKFSEAVKADPAAFAVAGAKVTSVSARGRDGLAARVAEGPLQGNSRPVVSFGTPARPLRDLAGNAAPKTSLSAADGAPPVIVAARTLDRDGVAGRIDTLALTFSEPVAHLADADGSYPFGVTGYSLRSAGAASGATIDLALNEGAAPDTGLHPPIGYTRGAGAPVRDSAGNEAASTVFAGASDGAVPRLLRALTVDANANGKLDGVSFEFTEPVSSAQVSCPACPFTAQGFTGVSSNAAAGATVTLVVAESAVNSGARPLSSFAGAGAVRDSAGNTAPAGAATATDNAPPVAIDAFTEDTDDNHRIDRVSVKYSEPLAAYDDTTGSSFTATGYGVSGVSRIATDTLGVGLDEASNPDTGSAPAIGYTSLGPDLRDANAVEHPRRSFTGLTRDAVAPSFEGARTADLNAGGGDEVGKIDAVQLVYSEEVQGLADTSEFTVGGGRVVTGTEFTPEALDLQLAEGPSFDTDATFPVSYTPSAPSRITDIAEGPGDTAEDASGTPAAAVDGAPPAIVDARTEDTKDGSPNGIVDGVAMTFSESVTPNPGTGPAVALANPALSVAGVNAVDATHLRADVDEGSPNGGATPEITVPDPARVSDAAGNGARDEAFAGTTDQVAPVLTAALVGEVQPSDGRCSTALQNGKLDCVRGTWSESVVKPASFAGMSLDNHTIDGLIDTPAGPELEATFAEGPDVDRTLPSVFTYSGGSPDAEVKDLAGNASLAPASRPTSSPCTEPPINQEPNDSQSAGNPILSNQTYKLCGGDVDWYRIAPVSGNVSVRISPTLATFTKVELRRSNGTLVTESDAAGQNGPGADDVVTAISLSDPTYWVRVTGPTDPPAEGNYCADTGHTAGETGCADGGEPQ